MLQALPCSGNDLWCMMMVNGIDNAFVVAPSASWRMNVTSVFGFVFGAAATRPQGEGNWAGNSGSKLL